MNECYGENYILNGSLQTSCTFNNALVYEGDSIYEVIRLVRGGPAFFHDHMERLGISVGLLHKKMLADTSMLRQDIIKLIRSDRKKTANLKIVFNYNNDSANYLIYFIEPIYPSEEQYRNGVKGILFHAERRDPASKIINHKLRSEIYHKLINEGGYEALLVNDQQYITEGSRSNIFFIKHDTLFTAPDDSVLNGITRKQIIEICHENRIRVNYECVRAGEISEFDAVFMSGTSPVVLPFCCIGNIPFDARLPVMANLRKLCLARADESIRRFRSE